jgi:hypothetical protein
MMEKQWQNLTVDEFCALVRERSLIEHDLSALKENNDCRLYIGAIEIEDRSLITVMIEYMEKQLKLIETQLNRIEIRYVKNPD